MSILSKFKEKLSELIKSFIKKLEDSLDTIEPAGEQPDPVIEIPMKEEL